MRQPPEPVERTGLHVLGLCSLGFSALLGLVFLPASLVTTPTGVGWIALPAVLAQLGCLVLVWRWSRGAMDALLAGLLLAGVVPLLTVEWAPAAVAVALWPLGVVALLLAQRSWDAYQVRQAERDAEQDADGDR